MGPKHGVNVVLTAGQCANPVAFIHFFANLDVYPTHEEKLWNEWYPCIYFQRQLQCPLLSAWTTSDQQTPVVDCLKLELRQCVETNSGKVQPT